MTTHFLTIEIALSQACDRIAIEAALQSHGEPLRWAVTSIDAIQQIAYVEAIVTCEERVCA
jgi:hypothetical protein